MNLLFGTNTLHGYLERLESAFDLDEILQQEIGLAEIEDYYFQSNWGYLIFHSFDGAVHMALSEQGEFRHEDYLAQINAVAQEIQALDAQEILELGTGKGFNLHHLARQFPERQFSGLDLSPLHVAQSKRKLGSSRNTKIARADFHHLPYRAGSFDYVFEFESVCHALDLRQVLENAHRVLYKGGRFTLFDGFRVLPMDQLSQDEKKARFLIEKTLGIQEGIFIDDFQQIATQVGFEVTAFAKS